MGDILYGSPINSSGTLTKTGGFALTLTNLNAVSGCVQISSGNLVLAGISTPNIPSGISNSGQLTLNIPATVTSPTSGTGALVKGGTGTVKLRGNLSYTGNTTVNAGSLRVFSPRRPVTGALTVPGGTATLEPNPATLAALRGQGAPLGPTPGGQGTGGGAIPEPTALSLLLPATLLLRRKR